VASATVTAGLRGAPDTEATTDTAATNPNANAALIAMSSVAVNPVGTALSLCTINKVAVPAKTNMNVPTASAANVPAMPACAVLPTGHSPAFPAVLRDPLVSGYPGAGPVKRPAGPR